MSSARALPGLIVAGSADGQGASGHLRVVEHDGVGGDDGSAAHDHAMQHDGAVADEGAILDVQPSRWTMWPITQSSPTVVGCIQRRVQDAAVLHARSWHR